MSKDDVQVIIGVVKLGVCEGRKGEVKDVHEKFGREGVDVRGRFPRILVRTIHMHTKRTSAMVGLIPPRTLESVGVGIWGRADDGWHGIGGL